ncbi:MAG: HIT family protein [Spirochaetaceae bacterium]|jgi:histidine triad (HIT) family protein|nr:HIT family protein [Spirochaetaceae bacterium]
MTDCIFCKIIAGEIPSYRIYEDERVYAFLDVAEDADGHTLVVPKRHCSGLIDCDGESLADTVHAVQKLCAHYIRDCGFEGANVLNFTGECAGQTVFHLHFHIIPRKTGDGVYSFPRFKKCTRTLAEMQKILALG